MYFGHRRISKQGREHDENHKYPTNQDERGTSMPASHVAYKFSLLQYHACL